ncbi:Metalloenzyme, LuxS/M16 peptidase-like protein [Tribonema minus]|uniref:Metalloenzyme, LuxS/M16 peptidase-like protein n=1 Tax=Tribonema minus TaxID=303371 RepID=A0A836C9X1_9STRA|nr:Metalloenzyme, LuxS/M16 peptidase-like protein [Tribonema minus]
MHWQMRGRRNFKALLREPQPLLRHHGRQPEPEVLLRFGQLAALLSTALLSQLVEHTAAASATAPAHPKYELLHEDTIPEFGLKTALYVHIKSGAEVLSVVADDDNKLFGVGFRTPPENDAGAPHVFEHATLAGSTKYPLKAPFAEMLKTFLNALTYDDFTMYLVPSLNLKDFYNLVDIYMDAVLHPLAIKDPRRLQQEGWHYELEKASDPLTYQGVVMSEMKGVYSDPESALFPDTAYRFNAGGNPAVIPTLTFEYIQDFHRRFYHPANSRVFFYGNDPVKERLDIVDAYFKKYDKNDADVSTTATQLQKRLPKPRRYPATYSVADASTTEHVVSVNWVLNFRTLSLKESLELSILEDLLIGSSAAPLMKALTDSGLGTAPTGNGYITYLRQGIFTIGLLGVKPSQVDAVEKLILGTLATVAKTGFEPASLGFLQQGLDLLESVMIQWVHDRDPTLNLHLVDAFSEIIKQFKQGQVTVDLKPKTGADEREAAKLAEIKAKMMPKQIKNTIAQTKALKDWQTKPDSAAALATLPRLSLSDVNKKNPLIPKIVTQTGGISTQVLTGTKNKPNVSIGERTDAVAYLLTRGQALAAHGPKLMDIMALAATKAHLDSRQRALALLSERQTELEQGVANDGDYAANNHIEGRYSLQGAVTANKRITQDVKDNWPKVLKRLESMRKTVIARANMIVNISGDKDIVAAATPSLRSFINQIPAGAKWTKGSTVWAKDVNYVGKGGPVFEPGEHVSGSVSVVSRYLNNPYLWDNVRVKTGAYGAYTNLNKATGILTFTSYRDPNVLSTLETYDKAAAHLAGLTLPKNDLDSFVIGTISGLDRPQTVGSKALLSLRRHLTGGFRDELLATTMEDFKSFSKRLKKMNKTAKAAVVASKFALNKANAELKGDDKFLITAVQELAAIHGGDRGGRGGLERAGTEATWAQGADVQAQHIDRVRQIVQAVAPDDEALGSFTLGEEPTEGGGVVHLEAAQGLIVSRNGSDDLATRSRRVPSMV